MTPWATAFRSPHPEPLECRYCTREMRSAGARLVCSCGASAVDSVQDSGGQTYTRRVWKAPEGAGA